MLLDSFYNKLFISTVKAAVAPYRLQILSGVDSSYHLEGWEVSLFWWDHMRPPTRPPISLSERGSLRLAPITLVHGSAHANSSLNDIIEYTTNVASCLGRRETAKLDTSTRVCQYEDRPIFREGTEKSMSFCRHLRHRLTFCSACCLSICTSESPCFYNYPY